MKKDDAIWGTYYCCLVQKSRLVSIEGLDMVIWYAGTERWMMSQAPIQGIASMLGLYGIFTKI